VENNGAQKPQPLGYRGGNPAPTKKPGTQWGKSGGGEPGLYKKNLTRGGVAGEIKDGGGGVRRHIQRWGV